MSVRPRVGSVYVVGDAATAVAAAAQAVASASQAGTSVTQASTSASQAAASAVAAAASAASAQFQVPPNRAAVANTNYTVLVGDGNVAVTSLTATRTITLPAASAYTTVRALYIVDESGACSDTVSIIVAAAGSDTIAGMANVRITSPYQKLTLHSNGSSLWTFS